jgi:hypothetical protein
MCLLVSEEKIFFYFSQSEMRIAHGDHVFCLVGMKWGNLIEDLPLDSICKILLYLAKWFQRRRFLEIDQPVWRSCLLTDRDKMSNLYRRPSIDNSYQIWFIWLSGFRGEYFLEIDHVNKHGCYRQFWFMVGRCLKSCPPRLLGQMNWNLVGNICGRSSIKIAHFVRSVNKYGHHR